MTAISEPLVSLRGIRTHFGDVRAVDDVDLDIRRGETIGLVGESGSGKTTLARTLIRLTPATSGQVIYDGADITKAGGRELRRLRRRVQMIFQDPYSSLSPRRRVSSLLMEPATIHKIPAHERTSVADLLDMVELSEEQATKYPHELSGGQARRVGIARALSLNPEFLVADEPTAGLDVSAAAAILNLMADLGTRLGLTYLIITHNVNVVGYIADRIAVMYLGQLAEVGPAEQVLDAPAHPYTQTLLSAVSEPDPSQRRGDRTLLAEGEIPSPRNPPPGCRFHTRCRYAEDRSRTEVPMLEEIEPDHLVACHYWRKVRDARHAQESPQPPLEIVANPERPT
jgi:oligopeptide/dipeptide ABC transporter ATP-binding protein